MRNGLVFNCGCVVFCCFTHPPNPLPRAGGGTGCWRCLIVAVVVLVVMAVPVPTSALGGVGA